MSAKPFPWRTLAIVSLALNLAFLGVVVGGLAAGARFHRFQAEVGATPPPPMRVFAALPREERSAMRQAMARSFMEARPLRRASRDAREALGDAVTADPYDPVAVAAAFERVRAADQALQSRMHAGMVDALAELSAENRAAVVRALERRGGEGRRRRDGERPDPDAPPSEDLPPPP